MDEDEGQSPEEEEYAPSGEDPSAQLAAARKRIKELNAENKERRESLEAMETTFLAETYDEDLLKENAELLEGLSFPKQKALLKRLSSQASETQPDQTSATETRGKAPEEPEPAGLAAVSGTPAPGSNAAPNAKPTAAELYEIYKNDPQAVIAKLPQVYPDS